METLVYMYVTRNPPTALATCLKYRTEYSIITTLWSNTETKQDIWQWNNDFFTKEKTKNLAYIGLIHLRQWTNPDSLALLLFLGSLPHSNLQNWG